MAQDWTDDCFAGGHVAQTDLQNIENNFQAIKSAFSGASAPSDTVAGIWWYDTTNHLLKIRNEANSAWLSVWDLANNKPVIANLSGEITLAMMHADQTDPAAGTAGLRTLGTGALQALPGNTSINADGSITQAKLATSTASVSGTGTKNNATKTGGMYSFGGIQAKVNVFASTDAYLVGDGVSSVGAGGGGSDTPLTTSYVSNVFYGEVSDRTIYGNWTYITSSGEVPWIFICRDKSTGKIYQSAQAPDHVCFGNGGNPVRLKHPFNGVWTDENGKNWKYVNIGGDSPIDEVREVEIIVINLDPDDYQAMRYDAVSKDADVLELIFEKDIPVWSDKLAKDIVEPGYNLSIAKEGVKKYPTKPVTVGLPIEVALDPYNFMGLPVIPIKKVIPQPKNIIVAELI